MIGRNCKSAYVAIVGLPRWAGHPAIHQSGPVSKQTATRDGADRGALKSENPPLSLLLPSLLHILLHIGLHIVHTHPHSHLPGQRSRARTLHLTPFSTHARSDKTRAHGRASKRLRYIPRNATRKDLQRPQGEISREPRRAARGGGGLEVRLTQVMVSGHGAPPPSPRNISPVYSPTAPRGFRGRRSSGRNAAEILSWVLPSTSFSNRLTSSRVDRFLTRTPTSPLLPTGPWLATARSR